MPYQTDLIYHVYNQGNNRQPIFFEERNYPYFLGKMKKYIRPYADFLAYCLMPNHFHWLLVPKEEGCRIGKTPKANTGKRASLHLPSEGPLLPKVNTYQQKLSEAISITLSSYTKAINKAYGRSGSLFRPKTKAKNGWMDEIWDMKIEDSNAPVGKQANYGLHCFYYIHINPEEAGLVNRLEEWEYSSARDYAGLRDNGICNYELAERLLGVRRGRWFL